MAEARVAVQPHPVVARVGFEVDTSLKETQVNFSASGLVLFVPHPRFLWKNTKRSIWRAAHKVQMAYMPFPAWLVLGVLSGVSYWVTTSTSSTWQRSGKFADLLWKLDSLNPLTKLLSTEARVAYLAFYTSAAVMLGVTSVQRFCLRQLLGYHGWMFHGHGQAKSLKTKLWAIVLKYVYIRRIKKNLYAYQSSLPSLPLPPLEQTCARYLKTVEALLPAEEFATLSHQAATFQKSEGPVLQRWLKLKWLTSTNYVADWWLNYVYLRGRESVCINSNWYGVLSESDFPTHLQSARAASMVYNLVRIKCRLDDESWEPLNINGMVPFCMAQYEFAFSTTRIPGHEQDTLVKTEASESRHIVVLHKGKFYKMNTFSPKSTRQLTPYQLWLAIEGILSAKDEVNADEVFIPALTAANRTHWASVRSEFFLRDPVNRPILEVVEKALFVLALDSEPATATLTDECMQYFVGNGHNRWSDKSFCIVVTSHAKVGVHCEHAWGDAPIMGHIIEQCSTSEEKRENYNEDGTIKKQPDDIDKQAKGIFNVYPAERLRFNVAPGLAEAAREADKVYRKEIADVDLCVERFKGYGKGFVKKHGHVSPDAWIQLAMQIAYFRDQGRFDQTYESSMTRLFALGRTETIRSASTDSVAFVRAFEDPAVAREEKVKLLVKAANHHQHYSHLAMTGGGVDRHLFALYVVSVGKNVPSPFLRNALGRKWKLSTSQVPTRQVPASEHPPGDLDRFATPNGGFGPVADDGYGVSYCIFGENIFYFNVSSKKHAPNTNSKRFLDRISQALRDMAELVQPAAPKAAAGATTPRSAMAAPAAVTPRGAAAAELASPLSPKKKGGESPGAKNLTVGGKPAKRP